MYYQSDSPHGGDNGGMEREMLDFSANTNPLGTPPGVIAAAADALSRCDRYPDPYCRGLVRAIAAAEGLPARYILCGNGAAELIYAFCAAVRPATAVECAPCFSEYSAALRLTGCTPLRYALLREDGFLLQSDFLRFLEENRPEAVFLCNPNNPTGREIPPPLLDEILAYCHSHGVRLFLDECFIELSDHRETLRERLSGCPGLFLLRAFTKSRGMAGLRLGCGLSADGALLERMAKLTPPWNVSAVAQAAGVAALREREFLARTRALIAEERPKLAGAMEELGLSVCPSEANFLLFRGQEELGARLRERGVLLRDCRNFPGLGPGWYRAAVRTAEENLRLLAELKAVLRGE